MSEELKAIERNLTWELVKLPPGKNLIGLKWLYKTKVGADGKILRHKARLVAKGYSQQYDIDYQETFAPVARFETIRIVLSVAAQKGWKVHQLDVESAFLNGDLTEEIYVEQPQGFNTKDFKLDMKQVFEMTDMGLLKFFLGLEVRQTKGGLFLCQEKDAKGLLKKFGLLNCKSEDTPMNSSE